MKTPQIQRTFLISFSISIYLLISAVLPSPGQANSRTPISESSVAGKARTSTKPQQPHHEVIPNWKDLQSLKTLSPEKKHILWNIFCSYKEQIKTFKTQFHQLKQSSKAAPPKAMLHKKGEAPSITMGEAILLGSIEQGQPDTQLGEDLQPVTQEQKAFIDIHKKIEKCKRECWQAMKRQLSPQEIKEALKNAQRRQQQMQQIQTSTDFSASKQWQDRSERKQWR